MAKLEDLDMKTLCEQVLPFRSEMYLSSFLEKLGIEGIVGPADLAKVSKDALELKLSTHASFNFIEMADAVTLRVEIGKAEAPKKQERNKEDRRGRSRSNEGRRGRKRNHSNNGGSNNGGGRGQRNNSRPHRGNNRDNKRRPSNDQKPKPDLWAAVEENNDALAQQLLANGADPEERYEGWTPLMKAAEEGAVEVMRMLLSKKVDIEASNRKGRTALSFAASPSFNSKLQTERDTPVQTLRLLLENNADSKRKDANGRTAKEFAAKQKREDAVAVFEEFGL